MIETEEIDIERLMAEIREAVARREAEGGKTLIGAAIELDDILSALAQHPVAQQAGAMMLTTTPPPPLRLQPEFVPAEDDHYHVNDLLQYHDHTFVWNAYRAILKREPDEAGLSGFLKHLRSGRFNKLDVLVALRFSPEGKTKNVRVEGLERRPVLRRLYRVPLLGYLLETIIAAARLPTMIRSQRRFEAHALAQQDLLASQLNQLSHTSFQIMDSLSRELQEMSAELQEVSTQLAAEQRKFAELQHQEVVGLFREQREIAERLEKLKADGDARLAGADEQRLTNGLEAARVQAKTARGRARMSDLREEMDELFARFADEFRGPREAIKEGLRVYVPLLKAAGIEKNVLDLGCGRGEWLELLKEEGIEARGVEINRVLAEEARSRSLKITEEDALAHLRKLEDESLDAVTGFHFIEHLGFDSLIELLDEAARVLRTGGLAIFETPNPKNLVVGACNFYSDPTHNKPLFPETVCFILSNRGFADVRVEYVNPVCGSPFLDASESSRALDNWFYGPRDFAVIGRKA